MRCPSKPFCTKAVAGVRCAGVTGARRMSDRPIIYGPEFLANTRPVFIYTGIFAERIIAVGVHWPAWLERSLRCG